MPIYKIGPTSPNGDKFDFFEFDDSLRKDELMSYVLAAVCNALEYLMRNKDQEPCRSALRGRMDDGDGPLFYQLHPFVVKELEKVGFRKTDIVECGCYEFARVLGPQGSLHLEGEFERRLRQSIPEDLKRCVMEASEEQHRN